MLFCNSISKMLQGKETFLHFIKGLINNWVINHENALKEPNGEICPNPKAAPAIVPISNVQNEIKTLKKNPETTKNGIHLHSASKASLTEKDDCAYAREG